MGRHGEGSVYPSGDGRFRAYITLESGKRKYFSGKTKKEVKEKLKKAQLEQQQGILPTGPEQTLAQYLADWLAVHKERVRPRNEVRQFLEAAKGHPREALFIVALATGMRRGELLGLKWQDINLEARALQVRRSLTRMPTGQGYKETEPKTKSGRRSIALVPFAVEALGQHWEHQQEEKARAGELWQDHGYVFCKSDGSHLNPGHDVYEQFKIVLKKAGLPDVRFHDLRHSTATLLLSKGVHPKVVQEILGHSAINITMDTYSHVLPNIQRDAMGRMDDFFG